MAEIAVQRKRTFPWWAWLLVALATIALLWALLGRDRGVADAERQRAAGDQNENVIRELAVFHNTADASSLVGRRVQIDSANVLSVTGDRDFWIGDSEGRQVLVILNQVVTPNQPQIEGRYDVNPGQKIAILDGEVKRSPSWDEARAHWNLDANLRSQFENQQVYIEADKLNIQDWRETKEPVQTQPK